MRSASSAASRTCVSDASSAALLPQLGSAACRFGLGAQLFEALLCSLEALHRVSAF
jgi:hypothetical protein